MPGWVMVALAVAGALANVGALAQGALPTDQEAPCGFQKQIEESNRRASEARRREDEVQRRTVCMQEMIDAVRSGRVQANETRAMRFAIGDRY